MRLEGRLSDAHTRGDGSFENKMPLFDRGTFPYSISGPEDSLKASLGEIPGIKKLLPTALF